MGKRANGEGSVFRRKDGRWVADYTPLTGGKRRSKYARTQREALKKLEDLKVADRSGALPEGGRETFGEYVEYWLEHVHRRRVRASTFGADSALVRKHIAKRLGSHKLTKLRPEHIEVYLSEMEKAGASPRTIAHTFIFVRSILRAAVRAKRIHWSPVEAVEPPPRPSTEAMALTREEATRLLDAATQTPHHAFIALAVNTGARFGELAALTWADVDLSSDQPSISITKAQAEVYDAKAPKGQRHRLVIAAPKTKASVRIVPIGKTDVAAALRELRKSSGTIPHPTTRVFTDAAGSPLRTSSFRRKAWKPLLRCAGLPETTQFKNATRHTAASVGAAAGVTARVMQERLGHSSIATTLQVYTHPTAELHEQAAATLEAAMIDSNRDSNQGVRGRISANSETAK